MTPAHRLLARAKWYSRIGLGRARRAARLAISGAGVPIRKRFLTLDCADGEDASGLFSEVAAVVGCIAEVSTHPAMYAGMRVDFHERGLYFDAAAGSNWWEYYFEKVAIGSAAGAQVRAVSDWEHDAFASTVELAMPRMVAARIVQAHVVPKPGIVREVDRFWETHFAGMRAIGVHYRGTDKWEGAPVVPYEAMAQAVEEAARSIAQPWRAFLATDEQPCAEFMKSRFGGQVVARDTYRSTDGRPLHKLPGDGFRKGFDAVIDCLLLARATHLIRTDSDLSLFATFFNPSQSVHLFGERT